MNGPVAGRLPTISRFPQISIAGLWLCVLFVLGGSSRADVPFLVVLRPLSVAVIGWAIWRLDRDGWRVVKIPVLFLLAYAGLAVLHLLPLPPALWDALPNRGLIADIAAAAGLADRWLPLSVAPPATRNAALSVLPVLALALLLGTEHKRLWGLLPWVLGIAAASAILGMLQMIVAEGSLLFFYRHYNYGSPIGFFANRNHQAIFLSAMIPAAAAYAIRYRAHPHALVHRLLAAGLAAVILLLLPLLGSRAGFVTGGIGGVAALYLLRRFSAAARLSARAKWAWRAGMATALLVLAGGVLLLLQIQSQTRLATGTDREVRFEVWGPILEMTKAYFPWGSGIGSFVEAYRAAEPVELLRPNYLNHAHNDWLEIAMTGGIPLMLLVGAVCVYLVTTSLAVAKESKASDEVLLGTVAAVWFIQLAFASCFEYLLRTPAVAGMAVVGVVWLSHFRTMRSGRHERLAESGA